MDLEDGWLPPVLGEKHGPDSPSGSPEGTNPAGTLTLDFGLQNWEGINFCVLGHTEFVAVTAALRN